MIYNLERMKYSVEFFLSFFLFEMKHRGADCYIGVLRGGFAQLNT